MARLMVTGGLGFIGSHMVRLGLAQGHQVAMDNLSSGQRSDLPPGAALSATDLRDAQGTAQALTDYAPDWISHHAAQVSVPGSFADPLQDAEVNILGTLNLLLAARQCGVRRVVLASTGDLPEGLERTLIRIPFVTRQESGQRRFLHSTSGTRFAPTPVGRMRSRPAHRR